MNREVTMELLEKYGKEFVQDRANRVAQNAVVGKGVNAAATDSGVEREIANTFSISLEQGKITNQKKSGRCWMFAALNCMRFQVMKHCNLETFELSQNYTLFYDKLEKSNYFLNTILDTLEEDTDSRLIAHLLSAPLNDGGQWDMLCAIVDKYGLVPKEAMPESEISSNTNEMVSYMTEKLREFACTLREAYRAGSTKEELLAKKEEMMQIVYNMLCICLGNPPKTFDFEYTDTDKVYHCDRGLTPKQFLDKYVGSDFDDYAVIIASPIHAVNRTYCQPFMGDVVEDGMFWLNLSQEELEDLTIRQLQAGEGVMFSCDCHPDGDRANGYWDPDCFQYGEVLGGLTFGMTKSERLLTRDSTMNHCMMFCGVNLDEDGTANRWKIENSWGEESGQKGYYIGSEKWFQANVYQVTVRKSLLSDAQRALLAQEPLPMKLWDPLA